MSVLREPVRPPARPPVVVLDLNGKEEEITSEYVTDMLSRSTSVHNKGSRLGEYELNVNVYSYVAMITS